MRVITLLGVSLAIAGVLVQAGCSKDEASSQDSGSPRKQPPRHSNRLIR